MNSRLVAAATAALLCIAAPVSPAAAVSNQPASEAQAAIQAVLAQHPDAIRTGVNEVSWDDGAATLTWASPSGTASLADCPAGSYCAWSGTIYTGTRLTLSTCSAGGSSNTISIAVRSIANRRSSGHVTFSNGTTVVHDLAANTSKSSVTGTLTKATCFTS